MTKKEKQIIETEETESNDFIDLLKSILGLILFLIIIPTAFSNAVKWCKLKFCYMTGHCIAKEFQGQIFPAKTTKEVDYKITSIFNDDFIILNIKSQIIHDDPDCKYAQLCTDNCIYVPKEIAKNYKKNNLASDCNYEFYTNKKCKKICKNLPERLGEHCIDTCIYNNYNNLPFNRYDFIENIAEEALEEEEEEDYYYD